MSARAASAIPTALRAYAPPPDFDYTTMAYVTRSLAAVLAVRLATDLVDATTAYTMDETSLKSVVPMVAALLIAPAAAGLVYLWRRLATARG